MPGLFLLLPLLVISYKAWPCWSWIKVLYINVFFRFEGLGLYLSVRQKQPLPTLQGSDPIDSKQIKPHQTLQIDNYQCRHHQYIYN